MFGMENTNSKYAKQNKHTENTCEVIQSIWALQI